MTGGRGRGGGGGGGGRGLREVLYLIQTYNSCSNAAFVSNSLLSVLRILSGSSFVCRPDITALVDWA